MTYQCYNCKRYLSDNNCSAFLEGIPEKILTGEFNHTKKHPDQKNDILFEPIEAGEHTGLKP